MMQQYEDDDDGDDDGVDKMIICGFAKISGFLLSVAAANCYGKENRSNNSFCHPLFRYHILRKFDILK